MGSNIVTQGLTLGLGVFIAFGMTYGMTLLLIKINKKLTFLLPILFGILSIIFWVSAFLSNDWGALGYFIMGGLSVLVVIGSLISSMMIHNKQKKE